MSDVAPGKQPSDNDKTSQPLKPQVAGANKTGKYLTVVLMAIVAVILGRGFFTTSEYVAKKITVPVQAADNNAVPLNLNVEIEKPAPPAPVVPPAPTVIPPPPSVLPQNLQQGAQADDVRLKAPSLVYSAKEDTSIPRTKTENLASGTDANNVFAQQAANSAVVTVTAARDTNTDYKILQGKLISAILETAINSDLPGMTRAVVNKDVYSDTGKYILLPRGTRLIGQYNSSVAVGQTRVMIMWTRAITPQHVDIALGSPSTDSLGQAGMQGKVDSHFWQIFGTSTLLSVLGVGASSVNMGSSGDSALGVYGNPYQTAVVQGVMNSSNNVLQARINIQPTIYIQQGTAIQVFVARDLDFSTLRNKSYRGR